MTSPWNHTSSLPFTLRLTALADKAEAVTQLIFMPGRRGSRSSSGQATSIAYACSDCHQGRSFIFLFTPGICRLGLQTLHHLNFNINDEYDGEDYVIILFIINIFTKCQTLTLGGTSPRPPQDCYGEITIHTSQV